MFRVSFQPFGIPLSPKYPSKFSQGAFRDVNPQTIGKIDRRLGQPICWLLTCLRRIGSVFRRPSYDQPVRKILFIKMIELSVLDPDAPIDIRQGLPALLVGP